MHIHVTNHVTNLLRWPFALSQSLFFHSSWGDLKNLKNRMKAKGTKHDKLLPGEATTVDMVLIGNYNIIAPIVICIKSDTSGNGYTGYTETSGFHQGYSVTLTLIRLNPILDWILMSMSVILIRCNIRPAQKSKFSEYILEETEQIL